VVAIGDACRMRWRLRKDNRMNQKKDITPTSQVARDTARRLVEECVHDFLENRDEGKAMALLEQARLCIDDAKSIEKKGSNEEDRMRRLN